MVETRRYENGKLILEDNFELSNIPEFSIYIKIFKICVLIGIILGLLWILAFIFLGVLNISDERVVIAAIFLVFGFIIYGIGTFILINPFVKYSRIIHGVGSILTPIPSVRLAKFRNLYLSYPNQKKLSKLLNDVKKTKFKLRFFVILIGISMSIVSIILYTIFIMK